VPAQTAERIAARAGVNLSGSFGPESSQAADEIGQARKTGAGALLGYVAGLGVGVLYGAIRPCLGDAPIGLTGVADP